MSTLNFPTNPSLGQKYTLGTVTYTWSGTAWLKTNGGNQTFNTVTATNNVIVGTGTSIIVIGSGTVTVNGLNVLTSATVLNSLATGTDISINTSTGIAVFSDISTLQSVTNRGNGTSNPITITNATSSTSTITGALRVVGGAGIGGDVYVGGDLYATNLQIADAVLDSTLILVNNTATTVIDAYSIDKFRSAKYLIQIDEGMGPTAEFEVIELLLLVDNIGTVYATEYGILTSNGELGEFAAALDVDNKVKLYFTAHQESDKEIVILRTALAV